MVISQEIPPSSYIEDEGKYIDGECNGSLESAVAKLQKNYQTYKLIETNLLRRKIRFSAQIPPMESNIDCLNMLNRHEKLDETYFMLSDQVFSKAKIVNDKKVYLWLGANTMLEYSFDEAFKVLEQNLKVVQGHVESVEKQLEYLLEQITITEVNLARIHNYGVKIKQILKKSP